MPKRMSALAIALADPVPALVDADALILLGQRHLAERGAPIIATPHEGELKALEVTFGCESAGSKPDRAAALARASGMVIVAKGPDTVIAAPDGRIACAPRGIELALGGGDGRRSGRHYRQPARGGFRSLHRRLRRRVAAWRGGAALPAGFLCQPARQGHSSGTGQLPVSAPEEILRIAAKGDGVTASNRFARGAAPGDLLLADGTLQHGPHHATPPCRHFGTCGGCQLQQLDEESLANFVAERVANAASGQGLDPVRIAPPHLSPPHSRRRASLRAESKGGRILLGFREGGSHKIVDLAECPVMLPELADLLGPIRKLLARQGKRVAADIELASVEQGVDLAIKGLAVEGLQATEAMLDFARDQRLARLTLDQGYGPEALWEPEPVTVSLSGISVGYPSGTFLQATADGEEALVAAAREWLAGQVRLPTCFPALVLSPWRWQDLPRSSRSRRRVMCTLRPRRRRAGRNCRFIRCTATCSAIRCNSMS